MQARLKKESQGYLKQLQQISDQQRQLRKQMKLSPELRKPARQSTVTRWRAGASKLLDPGRQPRRLWGGLWLSPRGAGGESAAMTAHGSDEATEAAMAALVCSLADSWL